MRLIISLRSANLLLFRGVITWLLHPQCNIKEVLHEEAAYFWWTTLQVNVGDWVFVPNYPKLAKFYNIGLRRQ